MSTALIPLGALVTYVAGYVVTLRRVATRQVRVKGRHRAAAIRIATAAALAWPLLLCGMAAARLHRLTLRGIPESQSEREERIAALEREVLDLPEPAEPARPMSARLSVHAARLARRVAREAHADAVVRDILSVTPPSGRTWSPAREAAASTTCARCGCPVVPGRSGLVHVPTLAGRSACRAAVAEIPPRLVERERRIHAVHLAHPDLSAPCPCRTCLNM
jgi:hypothetical protein